MTPIINLYFFTFIIIGVELVLMAYIFLLQPKLRSNQLFAAYMLMLSISSFGTLMASTATDVVSIYTASLTQAVATMTAASLLWLVIFYTFIPQFRLTRWLTMPLVVLVAVPFLVSVADWFAGTQLFFAFSPDLYSNGYVSLREVMNGRFGHTAYLVYISSLNSLLVIPIAVFAFTPRLPERLRRAARVLLGFSLGVGLLYSPQFSIEPALRSMLPPVLAAVGTAWVVRAYGVFSPLELAMKQVIDTVTIGLLVFDERLVLVDANATAEQIVPLHLPEDEHTLLLPELLQRMLPTVSNKTDLIQLQTSVETEPQRVYQQEIILTDGTANDDASKRWILLNIRPVYDSKNIYLGLSCSVEDFTVERRTQAYIAQTHKELEQYAYNQALVNDITQAAVSALDFEANLSDLASRLAGLFEAEHCYISFWDKETQRPKPAVAFGKDKDAYLAMELREDNTSISAKVCRLGEALAIEDVQSAPDFSHDTADILHTRGMLALPMIADEHIVGALLIGFDQPRLFSPEEVRWGEQIARQLTLAIYKNRLLESEREQRILAEALQSAGQALTGVLDFDAVMDRILDEIARVVPFDTANFSLVNKNMARITRTRGFEQYGSMRSSQVNNLVFNITETPTLRRMYQTKRPFRIANIHNSPDWTAFEAVEHIKSWLGVPLLIGGEVIAFLMVDKKEANFYQPQHEAWLAAFADQATVALQHARLFTEIQRRMKELEAVSDISAALRSADSLPNVLQAVLKEMVQILSAELGVVFLLNEQKTAVISQCSYPAHYYPNGISYKLGEGITGYVAQSGQVHIAPHLHQDPLRIDLPEEPEIIRDFHSTIALPLNSKEGTLGVIHLGMETFYEFADDEVRALKAMSNIVANGLLRIQVMQTLEARVASRTHDLEIANERLKELDKLKTKFIADVSHELRTPVANLSIYINLLASGDPEKRARYIGILQQQVERLTNLVQATLGLSKLEIEADSRLQAVVDLNSIVEEVVLDHQARAQAFGQTITCELKSDLPQLLGNKMQLGQLITNLVTNAINYNDKESGKIVVKTSVAEGSMICLQVVDDGMGIDEQEISHLFDRFYRGQRAGQSNIPGTGLGLSIVKEIVERHQGEILVQSQVDHGTTFCVLLPIYRPTQINVDVNEEPTLPN